MFIRLAEENYGSTAFFPRDKHPKTNVTEAIFETEASLDKQGNHVNIVGSVVFNLT